VTPGPFQLARHVPPLALDWLADTPEQRWRVVDGSMVFADISGFTALSERLATRGRIGAEELVETLSRVFGSMLGPAAARGGQLVKFGGDALLFHFDGPDHVTRACATAVELRAALRRAADVVTSVGRISLSISIGVHTGQFHQFLVGEPHRELVVLGPAITTLIACESSAEAGQIVVSGAVAAALPASAVRPRDDGALLLRWRTPPGPPASVHDPADGLRHAELAGELMPAILAEVLDAAPPDPSHRVATISFMRFSGTDELLAELGPAVLADRLHETLAIAQAAFAAEDVALLCVDCDSGGGKLFCSSGVPLTSEDDEGRMLRAARAITRAAPPLPLQIGINRGHVFAAEVGIPWRAAFSAMGDTTNTAARVCAKTPPGSIYAHPAVLEHARTRYEATPVGPFLFKGKSQPQVLHEVGDELGPRRSAGGGDVDGIDQVRFLGHGEELTALRDRLARTATGVGAAVVVSGEIGVGKSRLVHEALRAMPELPVVAVHAEPYGATAAYRMFRDPIRALLGIERGPGPAMAAALRAGVERLVPEHLDLLALVGDVVDVEVPPSAEVEAILPRYRADRTADVIVDLLAAAHPAALAVTVGDAHWADPASVQLVTRLARETTQRPWAVVVMQRSNDDDTGVGVPVGAGDGENADGDDGAAVEGPVAELAELEHVERLPLRPLDEATTRSLVVAATEAAPLRPHEIDQIVARASGNPLFVLELIRAIQELGSLDAVPTSLQGAMAAQVDALDPFAKRVLSYASVLGRSFRRTVLTDLLQAEGVEVDRATLERLGRFLEPDGPQRWRFRTGLVRDVAYDGLGYRLRARLHLGAGEAVERLSTDPGADADVLSLHFAEGGDHRRAYRYASIAAERAERAFATANAAAQLQRALESARRLPELPREEVRSLWIRLGDVRDQAGLLDAALDAYRQAARLGADPLAEAELGLRRARVRERAGAFPAALREATRVRRVLDDRSDDAACSARARAAAFSAVVRQRQERAGAALRLATAAAEEAERCGDRSALARASGVIAWAGLVLGRDDSIEHTRRALALFEEVGDLVGQAHMANNLGGYTFFEGDWDETLEWYARCEEACRRTGNVTDAALTNANTGEVLVSQGRLDEAEPLLRDAARVLRVSGHLWGATFAEMHLGRLLVARGDLVRAEALLRGCVEENAAMGSSASAYEAALHLGACLVAAGHPEEALELVASWSARATDDVSIFDAARAVVDATALFALGREPEAVEVLVRGVSFARERHLDYDLGRLLLLAARHGVDPALVGSVDPAADADGLLTRLGVVSTPAA
jgi:class 3 adenylate cyclase/tetratricopeptide (TPR) repeat protein